ncbi:BlaI/MecI/CopY family transcriptional regulator [Candidatus Gottesmanbacteria bacterium]|nr:BlaI/MecI/CopY family transcriptional regulator [Candidatus Gottesmanbacteria bacterium]
MNSLYLFKIEKSLGPLEFEVMKFIWKRDKSTVREVLQDLKQRKNIAYTTIMTVMDNLYKKGFLTRKKVKKSYHYSPTTQEDHVVTISLSRIFKDLTKDYGRRKVLYSTVNASLPTLPRITIAPIGHSISFTLVLALLGFSAFDLLQNLSFFGTLDYLSVLTSEPFLFVNRLHLFIPAFLESLPIVNILTTTISLILVVTLAEKLFKLLGFRTPSLYEKQTDSITWH